MPPSPPRWSSTKESHEPADVGTTGRDNRRHDRRGAKPAGHARSITQENCTDAYWDNGLKFSDYYLDPEMLEFNDSTK